MACYALPTSSVLLQHKGNVVVYPLDSLNAALRDAVDDDTLFLSKGGYPSFTIDKKITVRGAGQETVVAGTITVAIPDSVAAPVQPAADSQWQHRRSAQALRHQG